MINTKSSNWFGQSFYELHPLLQALHLKGGVLSGPVEIELGKGLAGIVGKRLAKKLGIPIGGNQHTLQVSISHHADGLHWDRCFDEKHHVKSIFNPVGTKADGYWVEQTGPIQLFLTVDIKDAGWYWRCMQVKIKGIRFPLWLFPPTLAYKTIELDQYRFCVTIAVPLIGRVLSYRGLLNPVIEV